MKRDVGNEVSGSTMSRHEKERCETENPETRGD